LALRQLPRDDLISCVDFTSVCMVAYVHIIRVCFLNICLLVGA
jgi:hypothetical protein